MTNMLASIAPKSDQLNADDLTGGRTLTIKITKVSGVSGEQPIAVNYDSDNGKPWYPCKSMRRVLVNVWGVDGASYVGRSLTLYTDPKVLFGGVAVGGLRISHMSHIDKDVTMALTATRANRKPYTVKPLIEVHTKNSDLMAAAKVEAEKGTESLKLYWGKLTATQQKTLVLAELKEMARVADALKEGSSDAPDNNAGI